MYYRAFHSLPDSMVALDGTPVNAIRGVIERITRLTIDRSPRQIIAAWDTEWRPQWRVDLIPTYKTHRTESVDDGNSDDAESLMPDDLASQIPILEEVLQALGIPVIGHEMYEADDIIGTYAHNSIGPIEIVTGDRDLFQLVDDKKRIMVLYTGKGEIQQVNEQHIINKYGISPKQYVDYAILRGDPSDGLPGVKAIGEKTASSLIQEFGDIEKIFKAALKNDPRIKPRIRENILASKDYLTAAAKVVPVVKDIELPPEDSLNFSMAPKSIIDSLAQELNLKTTFSKILHSFSLQG
jgi:5'-3' exonuclease